MSNTLQDIVLMFRDAHMDRRTDEQDKTIMSSATLVENPTVGLVIRESDSEVASSLEYTLHKTDC